MRVVLFGGGGQIGREILRRADARSLQIAAIDRARCDFMDPAADFDSAIADSDAVINAAAYTAVDVAESDSETAHQVNALSVGRLAAACARASVPIVHFSTDYVFDGESPQPYRESDETRPLSVYGATKLAGEKAIAAAGPTHAILRVSWVFSAHRSNFVKTMLKLGREGRVRVVADQRGKPTPASAAGDAALFVARQLSAKRISGVYHFAGEPETSRADFAAEIFRTAGMAVEIERISTARYPRPARPPLYSALDCAKFETEFGVRPPDWRTGLVEALAEIKHEPSEIAP